MRKPKVECNLPDDLRCRRTDNKSWRCSKHRTENSSYCEHHRDNLRENYMRRKKRKNWPQEEIIVIGISKQCQSNKYKIKEPEIAEVATLPEDILGLENLKDVLTNEAWRELLTPSERCNLRSLLPEGQKNNTVVESLLSGENFNFGNPALKWGESVCKGEQFPIALLQRERELKVLQSQYFKDLRTYRDNLLDTFEELKELCESCGHNDKLFRKELMKWVVNRLRDPNEEVGIIEGLQNG